MESLKIILIELISLRKACVLRGIELQRFHFFSPNYLIILPYFLFLFIKSDSISLQHFILFRITLYFIHILHNLMTQSNLTPQVLRLIDKEKALKPSLDNLFENPSNVYNIIRQMYNSFKKDNESRILQNKVYDLKLHEPDMTIHHPFTPVKMDSLFHTHSDQQSAQIIKNMLILKSFLSPQLQIDLIFHISKQIMKIHDLTTVLDCFKKIIRQKQCTKDKSGLYKKVESLIIEKILNFKQQLDQIEINKISQFLYCMPVLGDEIMCFISEIFEKTTRLEDFDSLITLFQSIYNKISEQQQKSKQEILYKSIMKITIDSHIQMISQKTGILLAKQNKRELLKDSQVCFFRQLERQTIHKIHKISRWSYKDESENHVLTEKDRKTIDFIFVGLQADALRLNCPENKNPNAVEPKRGVWNYFIQWYQICSKTPNWIQYVSEKITCLIQKLFKNPKAILKIIKLLLETEAMINEAQIISMYETCFNSKSLNETITSYIVRQILSESGTNQRYLLNKSVRQLLAFSICCDQWDIYSPIIINPANLAYIDIVMQLFSLPQPNEFFKKYLSAFNKKERLEKYLLALLQEKPNKYKQFFTKIDSYNQGQIFQTQQYYLLKFFINHTTQQMVISFLRQMPLYSPSKYSIELINGFINSFKDKSSSKLIQMQILRTLNQILCKSEAKQLCVEFKKHLKQIVESKIVSNQVFKNIPKKTLDDLKAFYQSSEMK